MLSQIASGIPSSPWEPTMNFDYLVAVANQCKANLFVNFPRGVSHEMQTDIIKRLRAMLDEELEIRSRVVCDA
jgi:hypothetical protein